MSEVALYLFERERECALRERLFIKSFCKSQFPHKSVNLFFILVKMRDTLTHLCGNLL